MFQFFCLGSKILCLGYVKEFWLTEAGSTFFSRKNHILQEFVYKQNRIYLQNRMYFEELIFIRTHTQKRKKLKYEGQKFYCCKYCVSFI